MTLSLPGIGDAPPDLDALRTLARDCTACALHAEATQTVFGEGPAPAAVMLVGEQPGDREDIAGRPFVGPAGRLLDECLRDAGIVRSEVYVTNAVKHFKFVRRGRARIHQTPQAGEVAACLPWLRREIDVVSPRLVVALGATAGHAVLGPRFRVMRDRGRVETLADGRLAMGTIHPSALLRLETEAQRVAETARLVDDLARVPAVLRGGGTG